MSGYKSFWGTCWNQMKLLVLANPLWPLFLRIPYKVPFGWVVGKGPIVMTTDFEESCLGDAMCCPFLAWMPNCHFSISFPLPPVKPCPCFVLGVFLAKALQQPVIFILAAPRRVCAEPASCLPTHGFFNQVMTNWLIQNLSRTKWWGRRLWHAAIIPQLSVVRPQNNYSFWDQASSPWL